MGNVHEMSTISTPEFDVEDKTIVIDDGLLFLKNPVNIMVYRDPCDHITGQL